jgi:hypothetical protein
MKGHLFIFLFILLSVHAFSQAISKDSVYHLHDSTFEIKTWKELNIIREFIRFEGKEDIYYKEFDLKTLHPKVEGLLKSGLCSGTWRFYKKKGKFDEIKFEVTDTRSYMRPSDPYDDVFKHIKQKCDTLFAQKKEKNCNFFFHLHSSQSYYYRSSFEKKGSLFKDIRPNAFLIRYDLVFTDGPLFRTFAYVELELDSIGNVKKENYSSMMTDYKNVDFISMRSAASIALKNGLTATEQPFEFKFNFTADFAPSKKGKTFLRVTGGHPFETKEELMNGVPSRTYYYRYIDINPWTGKISGSGTTSSKEVSTF